MSEAIWDRQDKEPVDAFERFQDYKILGPGRSLLSAYNRWRVRQGQEKSKSTTPAWRKLRKDWDWDNRALAWDESQRIKEDKRYEDARRTWRGKEEEVRQREWDMARKLIDRAEEMLNYPLVQQTIDHEKSKVTIEPARWSARDIPAYVKLATELARAASDLDRNKTVTEMDALKAMIDVGWLPEEAIDIYCDKYDEMTLAMRSFFSGAIAAQKALPQLSEVLQLPEAS